MFSSNERTLKTLKRLVRGYVLLLEAARERITFHGGTCDSVEEMERGDPYLAEARAAITLAEFAVETAGELALTRNALGNLVAALVKTGHPPVTNDTAFAVREARQLLGPPYSSVKTSAEGA